MLNTCMTMIMSHNDSPMQACTRTVSWVRRITLCFFPLDLTKKEADRVIIDSIISLLKQQSVLCSCWTLTMKSSVIFLALVNAIEHPSTKRT